MGIVSSIFVHVVINVCWQCRLYVEGDASCKPQTASPESGFLNTPDATSTPQSPGGDVKPAGVSTHPKPASKEKKLSKGRGHRLSEILSPVEQEMIRETMARGYGTPAPLRQRTSIAGSRFVVCRNVRRISSRDSIPDVIKRFPGPSDQYTSPVGIYRTRGIRI